MANKRWDLRGAAEFCLRKFVRVVIDFKLRRHQRMPAGSSARSQAWMHVGVPCVETDDVVRDARVIDLAAQHPLVTLAESLDKARRVPRLLSSRTHAPRINEDENESQDSVLSSPTCSARRLPLTDSGSSEARAKPIRDPELVVGSVCETVRCVTMRCGEGLDSEMLRKFPPGWTLEVLEIGSGPTGRRMRVREEMGRTGWVSVTSAAGRILIRKSRPSPQSRPWRKALAKMAESLTDRTSFRAAHPEPHAFAREELPCELEIR